MAPERTLCLGIGLRCGSQSMPSLGSHQWGTRRDVEGEQVVVDGVEISVKLLHLLDPLLLVGQGHGAQGVPAHNGSRGGAVPTSSDYATYQCMSGGRAQ